MATPRLSTRRQLELLQELQHAARQRAEGEAAIAAEYDRAVREAEETMTRDVADVRRAHAEQRRQLEQEFARAREAAEAAWADGSRQAVAACEGQLAECQRRQAAAVASAEAECEEARFAALGVYDASKEQPQQLAHAAAQRLRHGAAQAEGLWRDALTLWAQRGLQEPTSPQTADDFSLEPDAGAGWQALARQGDAELESLRASVVALRDGRLAAWFLGSGRRAAWWAAGAAAAALPAGWATGWSAFPWLVGSVGGGLLLAAGATAAGAPRAARRFREQFAAVRLRADAVQRVHRVAQRAAQEESQQLARRLTAQRDADLQAAAQRLEAERRRLDAEHLRRAADLHAVREEALEKLGRARDAAVALAEERYPPQLAAQAERGREQEAACRARRHAAAGDAAERRGARFATLAADWHAAYEAVQAELAAMRARARQWFPDWNDEEAWRRIPAEPPEALVLGELALPLSAVKYGLSEDPRLRPAETRLRLPACMTFAEQPRLAITARGAGRAAAAEALRLAVLRLLTALPAGKFRATLIDAAGLGENFAGFMHLNDFDEQVLGGRIWTDPKQIETRLALVGDHMEKVLQKYLRDDYDSIQQYNAAAGEVAEPYQVVAVANFPAGFSEAAARRLASLAGSGPRCGVYVLASIDDQLRLPHEFRLEELLCDSLHLDWQADRFVWRYPVWEKLALELDRLPPSNRFVELLRCAGQASREAGRVEVPFALAAPAADRVWTGDSSEELAAPIGRAGARSLQQLRLGRGTSQHVLISGKTGSGKSSLLHVLITNLALHYSPDQLEFYLVDFKKGVEFKSYAAGGLPHARVIAIESEREFGVSVLQRLDEEMRRRGELYRARGVQDIAGFRAADPATPLPRALLVIDEFQELFVTDDRLAQEAGLLLDRLVRQGRAFGIHVLLGSQTLAGAYSLARSTLGQMAVRIALECSEADAHLILSDDNPAARLLQRPGEAIYNDQNGLVAGNHPFQVVWLPDPLRQQHLAQLRERAGDRPSAPPAIVFEGNLPADPRRNAQLSQAVAAGPPVEEPTLWLGAAVRIEPDAQVVLRRQSGHHLAVVGSEERLAIGILGAATVAIAAQQPDARIYLIDGARPESPHRGAWSRLIARCGGRAERFPPRDAARVVGQLAAEVAARTAGAVHDGPPAYLVIHDLAQVRDLRTSDQDFAFAFSRGGETPSASADRQFREILQEGPAVGVHVLLWCESYNSLSRVCDRLALREIEFRVALPMSAADSTSWIDAPSAGQLGENRAIFYRDDLGTQVKFRPYAWPEEHWPPSR